MPSIKDAIQQIRNKIVEILHSGSNQNERPFLKKHNESNIPGLFIVGDLAGAPVIKYAMSQGMEVIEHIATLPNAIGSPDEDLYDVEFDGLDGEGNQGVGNWGMGDRY